MRQTAFFFLTATILLVTACKKDKPAPGGSGSGPGGSNSPYFFANTEWVGTASTQGQEYPQPIDLVFSGDTGTIAYCLFHMYDGGSGYFIADSMVGKITSIAGGTNGSYTVDVTYAATGDQQQYAVTQTGLNGGSVSGSPAISYQQFGVTLLAGAVKPASLSATNWSGHKIVSADATNGLYAYPDLATMSFNYDGTTSYIRNGTQILDGELNAPKALEVNYAQYSSRVLFYGYNEEQVKLVLYFGVLSADGNSMAVDARDHVLGRLPNYSQTIDWYGPPGETPIIYKTSH